MAIPALVGMAFVLLAISGAAAIAQQQGQAQQGTGEQALQAVLSEQDIEFARKAAQGGMLQVALSKVAAKQANGQPVQQFAQQTVDSMSRAGKQLHSIAQQLGLDPPQQPGEQTQQLRALGPVVRRLPSAVFKGVFGSFIKRGHDDPARAAESIEVHWSHYARHDGAAAFVRQVRSLEVHDTLSVADRLRDLRVPARIVWGASDAFQKGPYGERFARDLKAPLLRIEQGRHFTPEDHPETVANEIDRLLEDVRRLERPGAVEAGPAPSQ